ncbi:cytochrome P450 [Streptomyces sp. NPDC047108]|uniref:cytochrome P450 n=1 Tax=Streptomyces sp. NPDC047108 TaxID=3155025 RepID=UPI0033DFA472
MTSACLPPGPRLPASLQTALVVVAPRRVMEAARRRYGPVFRVKFLGFPRQVFVTTAELAQRVYEVDAGGGRAGEVRRQFMEHLVGQNSLLSLDGDPWWRHRRLLSPPLHGKAIAQYGNEIAEIAAENIAGWPQGRTFALRDRMQDITLEVILRLVFGIRDTERLIELRAAIPELVDLGGSAVMLMTPPQVREWTRRPLALRIPFLPSTRFHKARAAVDDILFDEIARRRADPVPGATDVLSRLLQARDEHDQPLSDQELRDELITLLEAGHETTATALAWTFERLLRTPQALATLRKELEIGEERYLEAVVKEALRARTVVYDAPRLLDAPLRLAEYEIPAGWFAAPLITLIHHDPEAFPGPAEFRPERFLGDEAARAQKAWMPFGGGRRYCVGAQLALLEMKVIIREVLQRTELTAPDPAPEKHRMRHVTFLPAKRAQVVARPRTPGAADPARTPEGKRRTVSVRQEMAVTPHEAWAAVADVTRMGEWSPECTGARWIGQPAEPATGARFVGVNRRGRIRWNTRCTITDARPGQAFAWHVERGVPLARWSFTFTPTEQGTLVEQTWHDLRVGPLGMLTGRLSEAFLRTGPRADHNEASMRATLTALKEHLER